jgi:membrane protein implicated in regulation of membrane protease activity
MSWESIYLSCFGTGLALSFLSFAGGFGHLHLGHLHIGHTSSVHARGSGVSRFNFFTVMVFLCWFGGVGYLLSRHSAWLVSVVLVIAVASGLLAASAVSAFMVKVLLPHERLLLPEDTEMRGVVARVNSTVHANGTGEILFSLNGTRRCAAARAEDGTRIERNTQVLVLSYEKGVAWVRPWTELDELNAYHPPG